MHLIQFTDERGSRAVAVTEGGTTSVVTGALSVYALAKEAAERGLTLREVVIEPGRSYFDTNVSNHHHFYLEEDGALMDIPGEHIALAEVPTPPEGLKVSRVDVVVRVTRR